MVATFKTLKTKRKPHQMRSARFILGPVIPVALCEEFVAQKFFSHRELRGPQRGSAATKRKGWKVLASIAGGATCNSLPSLIEVARQGGDFNRDGWMV